MTSVRSSTSILWAQVWGLGLVQGAIALTWIIYNLYLVQLLTQLGFPQGLATVIIVLENLLAMVMEPLMGLFSDQMQHRVGTRFPLISLGLILSAGCFLVLPTALVWDQAAWRWGLPVLLVAWALAMTVFRSPAMSLLGRYAFRTQLPQAASILTLVGGLAGAMGPLANSFILDLGPWVAFAVGSGVLLVAMAALRWVGPNTAIVPPGHTVTALRDLSWPGLGLVFGAGVGITLGFRLIMGTFPLVLRQQVPGINPGLIMGMIFIVLALTAIPAGLWATRLGNRRAMVLGLGVMTLVAAGLGAVNGLVSGLLVAALFGAAFSLVANGTIPFALAMVPADKAGLGTGLYFSGGALALSVFGTLQGAADLPPTLATWLAALGFLGAGVCVGGSQYWELR